MKRRQFIGNAISFSLLIAFHNEAQALSQVSASTKSTDSRSARFSEITLYTSKLKEQYEFYSKVLEFPVINQTETQFSLKIGASKLIFKAIKDGTEPFYHYAINIPSNTYKKAKQWLSSRTPLLVDASGRDLFYFGFWDAHAMYFKDPSGNIGELIARHTLDNDNDGEFEVSDLLYISEIGTPVESPPDFASELKTAYNLDPYGDSMFIGDEYGLFVAAKVNRSWIPENTQKASIYPTEIQVSDQGKEQFKYQNYPYNIKKK